MKPLILSCLTLLCFIFPQLSAAKELTAQEVEAAKKVLFEQINRERAAHGLKTVEYENLAAQVGDVHCREMLAEGYLSHWNRQGLKPYHRYALAGGRALVAENAFTWEVNPPVEMTKELLVKGVLFAQRQFMSEKPPHDGHRKNILDPAHTAVGIGLAYSGSGIRLTQEFITRQVTIKDLKTEVALASPPWVEGKPLAGYALENISLFFEPFPQPMSIKELKATSSYNLPSVRRNIFPKLKGNYHYSDGSQGEIEVAADGSFKVPLNFWKGPGVYTVVVWVKQAGGKVSPATNFSLFAR